MYRNVAKSCATFPEINENNYYSLSKMKNSFASLVVESEPPVVEVGSREPVDKCTQKL